jgi:hypothetical protein
MADGEFSTKLSGPAKRRLKKLAASAGTTEEALAVFLLEQQLFDPAEWDWGDDPENDPRTATVPPYDPDEPTFSHEEVMAEFRAELERRLAAKQ